MRGEPITHVSDTAHMHEVIGEHFVPVTSTKLWSRHIQPVQELRSLSVPPSVSSVYPLFCCAGGRVLPDTRKLLG
jgi:hypothetical protein